MRIRKLIITLLFNLREIEILQILIEVERERTKDRIFNQKYNTFTNEDIEYNFELSSLQYLFTKTK